MSAAAVTLAHPGPQGRGTWSIVLDRLRRDRRTTVSLALLIAIVMLALIGPSLSRYSPHTIDWQAMGIPPDAGDGHWLGTDSIGRDLLVRTLYGVRISLLVAVLATAVSTIIGTVYGAVSGFIGGWVDELMMRVVDVLYSLPSVFFVILLMVVFGSNIIMVFIVIGAVDWLAMARIVRGQTLSLRSQPFIEAAEISGATRWEIIFRHIIPNVLGPVVVYTTLSIPAFILAESFLSFLGLGVQEPLTSLGLLVADGAAEIETAPWILLVPAAFLTTILFCCNIVGDALRDALDPRSSG